MPQEPNYYAILGVAPDSEDVVIRAAYRAMMQRYHPDKNPSVEARQKTLEINAAYNVLGDSAKRAAYNARREATSNGQYQSKTPPPPPPPHQGSRRSGASPDPNSAMLQKSRRQSGGLIFATILTLVIIGLGIASSNSSNSLNTMNLDENMTMDSAPTDLSSAEMNMTDMNAAAAAPLDLSKLPQTSVSYSTIEGEAKRVAKMIVTKGIGGARAYSERCHKAVEIEPSWDGADSCAAFDYAAATIDNAISTQAGWPKNGYFQFQSSNQPDNYAAVGAPTYSTSDRLSKIRSAAEEAGIEAFSVEVDRMHKEEPPKPAPSVQDSSATAPENATE